MSILKLKNILMLFMITSNKLDVLFFFISFSF